MSIFRHPSYVVERASIMEIRAVPTEPMTLSDRILFHQIHAAKLVTDAIAAVLSLYYLWRRDLSLAIVAATVPPQLPRRWCCVSPTLKL
jgi:hypothetical protein